MRWRPILFGLTLGAAPVMVLSACEDSTRSRSDRDDDGGSKSDEDDASAEPDDIASAGPDDIVQVVRGDSEVRPEEDSRSSGEETEERQLYQLTEFYVNLSGTTDAGFLTMELALEVPSSAVDQIALRQTEIRDAIVLLTSDYTAKELEGLDGKLRLRDEIHRRIDTIMTPHQIERVYFTRFLVE